MIKRILAIFITIAFISTNSCLAVSELYYIKNAKTNEISSAVEQAYKYHGYNLLKKEPYFGTSTDGKNYAVVIMQQSGNNLFYYYNSDGNTKINKTFLKSIKNSNYIYEQSLNANAINIYDEIATKIVLSNGVINNNYSFEEPESVFTPPSSTINKTVEQPKTLKGYVSEIPSGTVLNVYLQNAINTASAVKGDRVTAVLTQNLTFNNNIIAPQGSILVGVLSKANHASYGSRNGRVVIQFNQLVTPENKVYEVSTEEIDFAVSNDGKVAETVKGAAGAAVAGAVVGLIAGLLTGSDHLWRNVAIGAGVGAGSSAVFSTVERGVDAEIPSMTEMEVKLVKPISVSVNY